MRSYRLLLLPSWFLFPAVADVDIKTDVCDGLQGGAEDCSVDLIQPSGSTPKYCADGPGQASVCGVLISTTTENVCKLVREALPGSTGEYFLSIAKPLCSCVPQAIDMAKDESFAPAYDSGEISPRTASLIKSVNEIDSCILNSDLTIDDSRSSVLQNLLQSTDGWIIVRGQDINTAMYANLMDSLPGCFTGRCDSTAKILQWYNKYFAFSDEITNGNLYIMLNDWIKLYNSLKTQISDIEKAVKNVQGHLATASNGVDGIPQSICKSDACKGSIAKSWLAKVSSALATVKSLQDITKGTTSAASVISSMELLTQDALESAKYAPDAGYLANLFQSGKINDMIGIIKGFLIVEKLPSVATELRKQVISPILLTKNLNRVKTAQSQLDDVLGVDWGKRSDLFKTTASRKVRDGFIQIQGIMTKELKDPLSHLARAIQTFDDSLNKFPLRKNNLELQSGAVSYKRWNINSLDVPCTSRENKTYTIGGFVDSIEYTKVEKCHYGPTWYYLPTHHIPYIKWRFRG